MQSRLPFDCPHCGKLAQDYIYMKVGKQTVRCSHCGEYTELTISVDKPRAFETITKAVKCKGMDVAVGAV